MNCWSWKAQVRRLFANLFSAGEHIGGISIPSFPIVENIGTIAALARLLTATVW
jgi:hypothetical protein